MRARCFSSVASTVLPPHWATISVTRDTAWATSASTPSASMIRMASGWRRTRSEEHTSELQSHVNLVCRLLLEKKKKKEGSKSKDGNSEQQQLRRGRQSRSRDPTHPGDYWTDALSRKWIRRGTPQRTTLLSTSH